MKKVLLSVLAFLPCAAMAAPGAYVSAGAGLNITDSEVSYVNDFTGAVGNVAVGYLWGDNTLDYGLELGGTYYPDSTSQASGVKFKMDGYNVSLLGVLKYITCSGFDVFGKVGGAYVDQKLTATIPGIGSASVTGDTFAPEVALGVGYMFNQNVEMDLTDDMVFAQNGTNSGSFGNPQPNNNANLILSVAYNFS